MTHTPSRDRYKTMGTLATAWKSRRALYVGISSYSTLNRWIEDDPLDTLGELGVGCIACSRVSTSTAYRPTRARSSRSRRAAGRTTAGQMGMYRFLIIDDEPIVREGIDENID